jgi:polyhydroxyalkanoate synthesis regulator phasin
MLTNIDLNKIGGIIDEKLEQQKEEIDAKFAQQRSELLDKLDRILKEVVASRQEETVLSHRVSDHEDRITALESTHS